MAIDKTRKGLATADVCLIIEKCDIHGVASLKFGDLELSFCPPVETPALKRQPHRADSTGTVEPHSTIPDATMSDQQHKNLSKAALEQDELTLREQEIAELLITDPLEAERMLRDEELEDDDDDEPGNSDE